MAEPRRAAALLCTDLDRTLLPNGPEPESPGARAAFAVVTGSGEFSLAYVSGRDLGLVERAIVNYRLPQPHYVIADVGTSIYRCEGAERTPLPAWSARIGRDWGTHGRTALAELCRSEKVLRPQPHARQGPYKLSYFVALHVDQHSLLARLRSRLPALGVQAELIYSVDTPAGIGLLDVIPAEATKLHAVEQLIADLEVDFANVLYAGDSGNDLPVLSSAIPSVLVANATDEFRALASAAAEAAGHADALYLARGGFAGMNGNYAGGILEGLAHFMPERVDETAVLGAGLDS